MVKAIDLALALGMTVFFAACAANPVAEDKSFDSKRTAEIIPIPVDVDTDLTRVYINKGPNGPGAITPTPLAQAQVPNQPIPSASEKPGASAATDPHSGRKPASRHRGKDGGTLTYRVKPSDTLMKIAFDVLGDLRRWHEIAEQNPGKIGKLNLLNPGTVLKIRVTGAIEVTKNGDPYLIRRRDTLIKISDHLYGTPRKWWALWDNNRELIHDPNRIYAGFTLYYQPDLNKRSFTQETPAVTPPVVPDTNQPETAAAESKPSDEPARTPAADPTQASGKSESAPALAPSEVPETAPAVPSPAEVPVSGA